MPPAGHGARGRYWPGEALEVPSVRGCPPAAKTVPPQNIICAFQARMQRPGDLDYEDSAAGDDSAAAAEAAEAAEAAAQGAAASARQASLPDCLALLRGPSDERRLVGLLLVTRLLSAQEEATLQASASKSRAFIALLGLTPLARIRRWLRRWARASWRACCAVAVAAAAMRRRAATAVQRLLQRSPPRCAVRRRLRPRPLSEPRW